MSGKLVRLGRLFDPVSGRSLVVPADHGMTLGSVAGLEEPRLLLQRLEGLKVDATLIGPGVARDTADLFARRSAPARILTLDLPSLCSPAFRARTEKVRAYALVATAFRMPFA